MPSTQETLGSRVAKRRAALKLTQQALSTLCNCALRTIQRIERDASEYVSQRVLEKLAEHLAMSLDELVTGVRPTRRQ